MRWLFVFLLLLPLAASAQQNQCRTSPVGASTAYCASEAFVTETAAAPSTSIQPGSTSVTAGTNLGILFNQGGILGNVIPATFQSGALSNPAAGSTNTTTGVMMGLGSVCKITPVYNGRVRFEIIGGVTNTNVGAGTASILSYGLVGTGIPVNNAPATGTNLGNRIPYNPSTSGLFAPISLSGVVSGLTVGVQYWFDANLLVGAGTGSLVDPSCNAEEL